MTAGLPEHITTAASLHSVEGRVALRFSPHRSNLILLLFISICSCTTISPLVEATGSAFVRNIILTGTACRMILNVR